MSKEAYYSGWPGKCPYNDDLNWGCGLAIKYLDKVVNEVRSSGKKGVVVFDVDDTLVMGDPAKVIGIVDMEIGSDIFVLPPNLQVVAVANKAKSLGFEVIALTARPPESKLATTSNLKMMGIPCNQLIMNEKDDDPCFKIKVRKDLERQGKKVVLTMGDQPFDCFMPGEAAAIKLPDPESMCCYAFFP